MLLPQVNTALGVLQAVFDTGGAPRLLTIPTVDLAPSGGTLKLDALQRIVVDAAFTDSRDLSGNTLIPPTLCEFAHTFQDDFKAAGYDVPLREDAVNHCSNAVCLSVDQKASHLDAAGRPSAEGYQLTIGADYVEITGASALGVWWGTRTLLQMAALGNGSIPTGTTSDAPGWGERGVMLDAGRHPYPADFLIEMCSYLSYFKQNTFHLHLSDNTFTPHFDDPDIVSDLYSGFRLDSDNPSLAGLVRFRNESYSRSVFDNIQRKCAARGVTVIPEIEAPGHALPITQWKPELALSSDPTMLNISHPDTIPTMKAIWKEFLPWMHSKVVHIGADEYSKDFVHEYNRFVNELNEFIQEANKTMRIWGTFPFKEEYKDNISKNVQMQHWALSFDNGYYDYLQNGYQVLNSDEAFYIVAKYSEWFPQTLNKTRIFHGDPAGGAYAPNIFDVHNSTNNPPRNHPGVLGHVAAMWSDFGPNATVYSEAYYAWRDYLPALADKQWGGSITEEGYDSVFDVLHRSIPGQNLDGRITSTSEVILHYHKGITDLSGNGYHAVNHGCRVSDVIEFDGTCHLTTPLEQKGRSYALSFSVKPLSTDPGTLFGSRDQSLVAGNGTLTNLGFIADNNPYLLDYSLPLHEWTHLKVEGRGSRTFVTVGGVEMEVLAVLGNHRDDAPRIEASIAIPAPLAVIGKGFKGWMKDICLRDGSSSDH